jgi:hypothetical protein
MFSDSDPTKMGSSEKLVIWLEAEALVNYFRLEERICAPDREQSLNPRWGTGAVSAMPADQ